jgi:hypothetical protein
LALSEKRILKDGKPHEKKRKQRSAPKEKQPLSDFRVPARNNQKRLLFFYINDFPVCPALGPERMSSSRVYIAVPILIKLFSLSGSQSGAAF